MSAACGASDEESTSATPGQAGQAGASGQAGQSGQGGAASKTPLTVAVVARVLPTAIDPSPQPIAGVSVALDLADGTRTELVADATGHVTFEGVDWSRSPVSVTTGTKSSATSVLGLTEDDAKKGEVKAPVRVPASASPQAMVTVKGTVSGLAKGHTLSVQATTQTAADEGTAPAYLLSVEKEKPFKLLFADIKPAATSKPHGVAQSVTWYVVDQPGTSADVVVDLDLTSATPVSPKTLTGSVLFPASASSPLLGPKAYGFGAVVRAARPSSEQIGFTTQAYWSADGASLQYEVSYLDLFPASELARKVSLWGDNALGGDQTSVSTLYLVGLDGGATDQLLDAPVFVAPQPGSSAAPLFGTKVVWADDAARAPDVLWLGPTGNPVATWSLLLPKTLHETKVPPLPTGVDKAAVLGAGKVWSRLGRSVDDPALSVIYKGRAMSPTVEFVP